MNVNIRIIISVTGIIRAVL